ncbi:MAG: hypothetical protein R3B39_00995 [Candidatus Paceibacterota bacterium]
MTTVKGSSLTKKYYNVVVIGIGDTMTSNTALLHQIGRVKSVGGGRITTTPKLVHLLGGRGIKAESFTEGNEVVMPLGYPKNGLPPGVTAQILASTNNEKGITPFGIVVVDMGTAPTVEQGTDIFSELRKSISLDSIVATVAAMKAGKIVCTTPKQLKSVLDYIEQKGDITEDVYAAMAKWCCYQVAMSITAWSESFGSGAFKGYKGGDSSILEKAGFFTEEEVTEEAVAQ